MTNTDSQPQVSSDERRRQSRHFVEAHITASSQSNFYCGFTENLSEGGVFVAMSPAPAVGELVHLSVRVGAEPAVTVVGEVRWHRMDHHGNITGCGLQFVMLEPRAADMLQGMLAVAGQAPLLVDT